MITNASSGTRIDEVEDGFFRIATPVPPSVAPGGFSFNQYLLVDDEPLLFHAGLRQMAPLVQEAIAAVLPVERLRWIAFAHVEADECGGLNALLAAAPRAQPLCSQVAATVSVADLADRAPRPLADGETLALGRHQVSWHDAPHVPHAWENGFLYEHTARALFCGDLFTQPGAEHPPVTEGDVLGPSETFRAAMDYYSHSRRAPATLAKLAATQPTLLLCMHGSAWRGDGSKLLAALADALEA